MGVAIQNFDWASTSLGPIEEWTTAQRMAIGMMLSSKFPMAVISGEELVTLYNDAFAADTGYKASSAGKIVSGHMVRSLGCNRTHCPARLRRRSRLR